jgi:putative membrane protein
VSVVTYVAAGGLALVGLFLGVLAVPDPDGGVLVPAMQLVYHSVPWLTVAALTASAGRLLDELIGSEGVRTPYLNLPFGVVAVGLVVRGVSGYVLEREGSLSPLVVGPVDVGPLSLSPVAFLPTQRLALLILAGIVVSVAGVRVATTVAADTADEVMEN